MKNIYESTDVQHITATLNLQPSTPVEADFAFVFGTRYPAPVPLAARLYHNGVVPFVVLTGGLNRQAQRNEAQRHFELLVGTGVPPRDIVVEDESTNTRENVLLALPLIAQRCLLVNIRRIVVVCKWFHARRALMTMKANLPAGIRYYVQTYCPADITPDNWHTTPEKCAPVLKNWKGIGRYLGWGHLVEIQQGGDAYI